MHMKKQHEKKGSLLVVDFGRDVCRIDIVPFVMTVTFYDDFF